MEKRERKMYREEDPCPNCGGVLVLKTNVKTGQPFLGCINYARKTKGKCLFAVNYEQIIFPEKEKLTPEEALTKIRDLAQSVIDSLEEMTGGVPCP